MRIAILGAGLIGRLLAYELLKNGLGSLSNSDLEVKIYEKNSQNNQQTAAYIAAAMLAPIVESATSHPLITTLGLASLDMWPQLIADLKMLAPTAMPIFFQQQGTILVWHPQDKEEAARFAQKITINRNRAVDKISEMQFLTSKELTQLEPSLSKRFHQGIYFSLEAQLDNRALLYALEIILEKNIVWSCDVKMQIYSDIIIDCRGLGAKTSWNEITTASKMHTLRGVRGEIIRVKAKDVDLKRPIRLLHPRYPIYIAPKPNNIYVIGATELETEDYSPISVLSTLELLNAAYAVHPGFAEARIIETSSQCRPTLTHNLPQIVWQEKIGYLAINGLYRHGYLISPAIVKAAIAILAYMQNNSTLSYKQWLDLQPYPQLFIAQ